jgi:hypothetical protein
MKHARNAAVGSALLVLVLLVCTTAAQAPDADVTKRLEGFDAYMAKVLKDWNGPGIGVGIVVVLQTDRLLRQHLLHRHDVDERLRGSHLRDRASDVVDERARVRRRPNRAMRSPVGVRAIGRKSVGTLRLSNQSWTTSPQIPTMVAQSPVPTGNS